MLQENNEAARPSMIQTLSDAELDFVSAGGDQDGETLAGVAAGIATVGAALAPVAPPVAAAVVAVAATTLLIAFVAEAAEG